MSSRSRTESLRAEGKPEKRRSIMQAFRRRTQVWRSSTSTGAASSSSSPDVNELTCGLVRTSPDLPPIIEQSCLFLEQHALQQEGIFRIPGSVSEVKALKRLFDKGKKVSYDKSTSTHSVAGVLKLFFTELPNSILTFELYDSFMAATGINEPMEVRIACMRRVLDCLPQGNLAVVKRVTAMFRVIQAFHESNKMTSKNISIVMGPTMFRAENESLREVMSTGGLRVRMVQHMILQHDELFNAPAEEVDAPLQDITQYPATTQEAVRKFHKIFGEGVVKLGEALVAEGGDLASSLKAFDKTEFLAPVDEAATDRTEKRRSATVSTSAPSNEEVQRFNPQTTAMLAGEGRFRRNTGGNKRTGIRIDMDDLQAMLAQEMEAAEKGEEGAQETEVAQKDKEDAHETETEAAEQGQEDAQQTETAEQVEKDAQETEVAEKGEGDAQETEVAEKGEGDEQDTEAAERGEEDALEGASPESPGSLFAKDSMKDGTSDAPLEEETLRDTCSKASTAQAGGDADQVAAGKVSTGENEAEGGGPGDDESDGEDSDEAVLDLLRKEVTDEEKIMVNGAATPKEVMCDEEESDESDDSYDEEEDEDEAEDRTEQARPKLTESDISEVDMSRLVGYLVNGDAEKVTQYLSRFDVELRAALNVRLQKAVRELEKAGV